MNNKHLINNVNLKLVFNTEDQFQAIEYQHTLNTIFKNEVLNELEKVFDELAGPDEVLRIDNLEIHVPDLSFNDPDGFIHAIKSEVQSILGAAISQSRVQAGPVTFESPSSGQEGSKVVKLEKSATAKSELEQFIYFLRTGQKAWYQGNSGSTGSFATPRSSEHAPQEQSRSALQTLYNLIEKQPDQLRSILKSHLNNPNVRRRLAYQFTLEEQIVLVALYLEKEAEHIVAFLKNILYFSKYNKAVFTHTIASEKLRFALWEWLGKSATQSQFFHQTQTSKTKTLLHFWQHVISFLSIDHHLHNLDVSKPGKSAFQTISKALKSKASKALFRLMKSEKITPEFHRTLLSLFKSSEHNLSANQLEAVINLPSIREVSEASPKSSAAKKWNEAAEKLSKKVEKRYGLKIEKEEKKYETYNVTNAGIPIAAPFLSFFFEGMGYTKKGAFISQQKREEAVMVIHHIATGKESFTEEGLMVAKVLCGIAPNTKLSDPKLPDEATQTEILAMLNMMIDRWKDLGKISPEGLRKNYFKRKGKLIRKDDVTWELQVEKSYYDVLLDTLPWGVAITKSPWTNYVLSTVFGAEIEHEEMTNEAPTEAPEAPIDELLSEAFAPDLGADSIHINAAGLVLTTPFIPTLFEGLGYLEEGQALFKDAESQLTALSLLKYITHGEGLTDESELTLHKLICGIPITTPVPVDIALNEEEKQEADYLLEMITIRWDALGKCSNEALVHNYFLREGVIAQKTDDLWELHVERKGVDVMLSRLPWGFKTINFNWIKYVIDVTW